MTEATEQTHREEEANPPASGRVSRPPVLLLEAELNHLRFRKKEAGEPDEGEPVPVRYGLGVMRFSEREFAVDFSIEFEDWRWAEVYVSYRALFKVLEDVAEERLTDTMRRAAAALGPIVLYPYIRQEVDGMLSRGSISMDPLPVLNVGSMFDYEKVELQQPQEEIDLGEDTEE